MICGSWVSPKTDAMWQANMAETIFICTCFKLTYSSSGRWFWLASLGFLRVAPHGHQRRLAGHSPLFRMIFPSISTTVNGYFPRYFPTKTLKPSLESPGISHGFSNGFSQSPGFVGTPPGGPNFAKALWPTRTRSFGQAPCTCSRRRKNYGKIHGKILEKNRWRFVFAKTNEHHHLEIGKLSMNIPLSCWISEG